MIADVGRASLVEELLGAGDLRLLDPAQLKRVQRALGLRNEVDVLDASLLEGDRPVGRVVADRRGDGERSRELGVHRHLVGSVEVMCEAGLAV